MSLFVALVRIHEPLLPGISSFLQTSDLLSLLTALERGPVEGDDAEHLKHQGHGRREESFRPWPSSLLLEKLTAQCLELKLKRMPQRAVRDKLKAMPTHIVGRVTVSDFGNDVTRRMLNGIHGAIQAMPLCLPCDATELVTELGRLLVTNRSATDGCVDFFAPDVPCRLTVASVSKCSGEECQLTSLLLCSRCGEALRACAQCAVACSQYECSSNLVCASCVLTIAFGEEDGFPPNMQSIGCLECYFVCVACGKTCDVGLQKAQCDDDACLRAFPANTCHDCAGVEYTFINNCSSCDRTTCSDCLVVDPCFTCYFRFCRDCTAKKGQAMGVCVSCTDPLCASCIKDAFICEGCGTWDCHQCHDKTCYVQECSGCSSHFCGKCDPMGECVGPCGECQCRNCFNTGGDALACVDCGEQICAWCVPVMRETRREEAERKEMEKSDRQEDKERVDRSEQVGDERALSLADLLEEEMVRGDDDKEEKGDDNEGEDDDDEGEGEGKDDDDDEDAEFVCEECEERKILKRVRILRYRDDF